MLCFYVVVVFRVVVYVFATNDGVLGGHATGWGKGGAERRGAANDSTLSRGVGSVEAANTEGLSFLHIQLIYLVAFVFVSEFVSVVFHPYPSHVRSNFSF